MLLFTVINVLNYTKLVDRHVIMPHKEKTYQLNIIGLKNYN